jgi:hypothetical protein
METVQIVLEFYKKTKVWAYRAYRALTLRRSVGVSRTRRRLDFSFRLTFTGGVFSEHTFYLRTCPARPIRAHLISALVLSVIPAAALSLSSIIDRQTDRQTDKITGGVFSGHSFFLRTCPARPIRAHTCPGITRRLCGWLGASGTQGLRALRLWQSCRQWRAQPWSCMDAAPGCRLQRRSSANILTAWPGRVAQAPRAGRARAPWSCSPCWRPSSRTARLGDQLQLDDEVNSEIADSYTVGS